ncbi:MAG: hypothetical protein MJ246_08140 [Clostridia bacterium]|nr:hypothetical protein [Clostridia bacterium]
MQRKEAKLAKEDDRKPRKLFESDYLMGVYDSARCGALRFKLEKDGPFLNDDDKLIMPP